MPLAETVSATSQLLANPLSPDSLLVGGSTAALVALSIVMFAECGLLIGFFLPGDTILFAAGIYISVGDIKGSHVLTTFLIVIPLAAILGNIVGYAIGYRVGPVVFDRPDSKFFRPEYIDRAHHFYERFGSWTVLIGRFVPVVRTFATVMAGVGRMRFLVYLGYSIVGGIIWTDGMLLLGHQLGKVKFVRDHKGYIDYLVVFVVVLGLIPLAVHYVQGRRKKV